MFVLYEVLLYLVFLLALPFFLLPALLRGKYLANFPERMGFYRTPAARARLWIHAVSVGETLAARPVVDEILRQRPGTSIVFTTTTITGQAQARRLFPDATVTYFPFDFAFARAALPRSSPAARFRHDGDGDLAERDAARPRARRCGCCWRTAASPTARSRATALLRPVVRRVLRHYDRILAREETDRERFIAIGAPAGDGGDERAT